MTNTFYQPQHKIRIISTTSLFDGHDAAINIMRRIFQAAGVEVIHLGHNRSVQEIIDTAIQEDVQGIAITSYQGGHVEFFKYAYDLLKEQGSKIKLIGGGGGTILPQEIEFLHDYGIARIYSPDDGRELGLEGMISNALKLLDFSTTENVEQEKPSTDNFQNLAKLITSIEEGKLYTIENKRADIPIIGVTGTGGAGKSSLVDELVSRFLRTNPVKKMAIISIDPSKRKTGGALLGDRIRMNAVHHPNIYMRSLATRQAHQSVSDALSQVIDVCKMARFDLILVESAGIGQSDSMLVDVCDLSMYVMTAEYGASTQLEKIDMLDYADWVVINKFDKKESLDAFREVRKQYRRSHLLWTVEDDELPIYGTIASQFNDEGVNYLYNAFVSKINSLSKGDFIQLDQEFSGVIEKSSLLLPERTHYLSEIVRQHTIYKKERDTQAQLATQYYQLEGVLKFSTDEGIKKALLVQKEEVIQNISRENMQFLDTWEKTKSIYQQDFFEYKVRQKVIKQPLYSTSLSGLSIPRVSVPSYKDWGDIIKWKYQENFAGNFPFTAGVFPLKRKGEAPTRMFAGEGGAERTNRRFHYISKGQDAKRLSTAFDSVTLYGEDPDNRPDIYGKVGNSGVSIASLDEAKKLYSGFDLCNPKTSVSMTINGPAPIVLAFFLNAAIDQQCEKYIIENNLKDEILTKITNQPKYLGTLPEGNDGLGLFLLGTSGDRVLPKQVYQQIKEKALQQVRGTVQADILKEDQAQNTCIFSIEFALKMMGDIQLYFTQNQVRNFYSVSISGYHIAEAGANPITQLAFTLANGFTYVEYYLARGLHIDDFAHNLSFFFSNGTDSEYAVIGRVARRIWAKAIKNIYEGNERSQKLKYHIQTSGRSLHAQEIAFNDIRTTLQALYAIYDNCNSLHTNAYDEAITTPTEESVRRAMAIQLIINEELGLAKNENSLQGSFIIEELTDLVEEAVMMEFERLSDRGGVLGAMERMYQRSKIQEESMLYEDLKHSGKIPIIGVNTFLDGKGSPTVIPSEVIRATKEEKYEAINAIQEFKKVNREQGKIALKKLQQVVLLNGNVFQELMETVKYCTLGQITDALYQVGGKYRRNM